MGGAATGMGMGTGTGTGTGTGETLDSVAAAKTPRGGSRNPRREEFPPPQNGVSPAEADTGTPAAADTGAIQLGLADAEQVDHEDQGAAGELVP